MSTYGCLFFALLSFISCSDQKAFLRHDLDDPRLTIERPDTRPDGRDVLTFFALGDWGTGTPEQHAVATALSAEVASVSPDKSLPPFVLGLGDNVYEHGLEKGWNNEHTTELLHATFGEVYDNVKYDGRHLDFYVVPGNHDHGGIVVGKGNHGDVIHQETTAEAMYSNWHYYPIDPAENADTDDEADYDRLSSIDILNLAIPERIVVPDERLSIVGIDSQVLLHLNDSNRSDLLAKHLAVLDSLSSGDASWKIIVGHHPLRTHGTHGGFRNGLWWAPPLLFVTLIDKYLWHRLQDTDHPAYKRYQAQIDSIMARNEVSLYFSGHEHNLQMLNISGESYQLISGAAGKLKAVIHKDDTIFSHESYGFARFDLTKDELWIEFFAVDVSDGTYESTAVLKMSHLPD